MPMAPLFVFIVVHGGVAAATRGAQSAAGIKMFEVLQDGISLARDFRTNPGEECAEMDLGVFIPIGNNWIKID
jgi:hypothetical protein